MCWGSITDANHNNSNVIFFIYERRENVFFVLLGWYSKLDDGVFLILCHPPTKHPLFSRGCGWWWASLFSLPMSAWCDSSGLLSLPSKEREACMAWDSHCCPYRMHRCLSFAIFLIWQQECLIVTIVWWQNSYCLFFFYVMGGMNLSPNNGQYYLKWVALF